MIKSRIKEWNRDPGPGLNISINGSISTVNPYNPEIKLIQ